MFFHIICLVLNIIEVLYAYRVTIPYTCNDHQNEYQTDEYPCMYLSILELYRGDTGLPWGITTLCYKGRSPFNYRRVYHQLISKPWALPLRGHVLRRP